MNAKKLLYSIVLLMSWTCGAAAAIPAPTSPGKALQNAIDSTDRPEAEQQRDRYRHPLQTLTFFGVKPEMTVVEIWPGTGWYSQILAPYLRDQGRYYVATPAVSLPKTSDETKQSVAKLAGLLTDDPARFGKPTFTEFRPPMRTAVAPPASADVVLSFRNVHNWIDGDFEQAAFDAFFVALKPGGTLGIVEHRGEPGETADQMKQSGYVTEAYIKALALNSGFKFAGSSNINNNPKDTKDYPDGVWTLPPTLRLGDKDRAKYVAIGESDRMTLKFVKPK